MAHSGNLLLDSISNADYLLLHRHLRPVELRAKLILSEADDDITHVYCPVDAIISIVVPLKRGEAVEAAMVGRDGVVGATAALDSGRSLSRGVVQLGGKGLMCSPLAFKTAVEQSRNLMSLVVRHEQPFTRRHNSPWLAWRSTGQSNGFVAGCYALTISSLVRICRLHKSFLKTCSV